jgi:hypothetical protein
VTPEELLCVWDRTHLLLPAQRWQRPALMLW